jgi:mRNA interferase RelE/StbE
VAYEIEWDPSARRELRKLDPPVARRIALAVTGLASDPWPAASTALVAQPAGTRRLRVGDYRVVYVVEDEQLTITVVQVRHRREDYRDL